MEKRKRNLRVAYVVQNESVNIYRDVGDAVPIKYTLRNLRQAGHTVSYISVEGRSVIGINDIQRINNKWYAPQGFTGSKPFMFFESGIRRFQRELGIPYFAIFNSLRFYNASKYFLHRFDICHQHSGLFSIGVAYSCFRQKIPYIMTFSADELLERKIAGQPLTGIHALVASWEMRFSLKAARKVICVSDPAKRQLIQDWQVPPNKIIVLPNGVDTDLFRPGDDQHIVKNKLKLGSGPIITFVGGFQPWHGIDQLINIFALVQKAVPDARLLLVGDGPTRPDIERLISSRGINSSVLLTGLIPLDTVPAMLTATDIAVIPYPKLPKPLWFSPLKLYEYMSAGKAIVGSRDGQIGEVIIDGYNGLLVDSGDIEGFAKAIVHLIDCPDERERLGENARKQVLDRHSWHQYISRLEEVYWSVL